MLESIILQAIWWKVSTVAFLNFLTKKRPKIFILRLNSVEKALKKAEKHLNNIRKTSECVEFHLIFVRICSEKGRKPTFLLLKKAF
jgi:hypothetical protein